MLVRAEHVVVPSSAVTAEDVIAELAGRLVATEHVDPAYVEACLARERTDPTGLPTGGTAVAIPHGDPDHVRAAAVAIAVPATPIRFGSMGDPDEQVDAAVVFLLALRRAEDQLAMLREVATLIQDPARLAALASAVDPADILDVLRTSDTEVGG